MIFRRIEVRDAKEIEENENTRLSLVALFLSLPWCCIMPAALSVFGFLGAAGSTRIILKGILFPIFFVSILFLVRAHYLIYIKKNAHSFSRTIVWISTFGALALWAFRFGLITI